MITQFYSKTSSSLLALAATGILLLAPSAMASEGISEKPQEQPCGKETVQRDQASPGTSVAPVSRAQEGKSNTRFTAATIQGIPLENIEGRHVVDGEGNKVGEIQEAVVSTEGGEAGLVVVIEDAATAEKQREVFVSIEEVRAAGKHIVWDKFLKEDELQKMPKYREANYIPVSADAYNALRDV